MVLRAALFALVLAALGCNNDAQPQHDEPTRLKGGIKMRPSAIDRRDWDTYTSPAGFYTIGHPKNWRVSRDQNIVNIIPPDASGTITISAYHGGAPFPQFPQTWLQDTFEAETPTSEMTPFSENGWRGIKQDYIDNSAAKPLEWIAIVAESEPLFVLITANDSPQQMRMRREIYEDIMHSLVLHVPE